ncbi:MAG: hypothetical protein RL600_749 [Actinomycetota bacterium]|jgi:Zn-dependent protease
MSAKEISRARKFLARALLIAALPLVFLGLIDPLEGGVALVFALATLTAAYLFAGYKPNKTLWIPFLLAIVVGAITLLFAILGLDRGNNRPSMIPLIAMVWVYRVIVLATLIGLVLEVIRAFKASTFQASTNIP